MRTARTTTVIARPQAAPQGGLSCPFGAIHLLAIPSIFWHVRWTTGLPRRFAPRNDVETWEPLLLIFVGGHPASPTFSWERTFLDRQKPGHPFGCPGRGYCCDLCQVRTMPDHTSFTRLSSSTMPDSLAVGPADLLKITLQHAVQVGNLASLVANLSDAVPLFRVTRAFCSAFCTASAGCARIGTVIGCIAFRTVPHQFINRFRMDHIRCGIWIYAFALRTHHMGIPAGVLKCTSTSASDHLSDSFLSF